MYNVYSSSTSDGIEIEEITPDAKLYCRTCSQQSKDMIQIFEEEGLERMLADKINKCLPISVLAEDFLPLQLCLRCVLWLETTDKLRTSCLYADDKLRVIFTASVERNKEIIDLETESDDDYRDSEPLPECGSEPGPEPVPEPVPEPMPDVPISGALQFLAVELGVTDPKSLLIVEKQPQVPDTLELRMSKLDRKMKTAPAACGECGEEFHTQQILRNHHLKNHNRELFPCPLCYVYYSKYDQLREHVEMIHPIYSFKKPTAPKNKKPGETNPKRVVYMTKSRKCKKCRVIFDFKDIEGFNEHMKQHRIEARDEKLKSAAVKCDYCDVLFLTERSKIHHMKITHGEYKPYVCSVCSKAFHTSQSRKDHSSLHGSERPFLCSVCGKCFANKSALRSHMHAHEAPSICKICDKEVSDTRKFQHKRNHYDKRIFQCLECGCSFFEAHLLRGHVAKKHYTDIFQCEICGCCYNSQSDLLTHEGYHKDVLARLFKCPIKTCRRQFTSASSTAQHCQSDHTKEERFKMIRVTDGKEKKRNLYCWSCDTSFRHTNLYIDHVKTHESELGHMSGQAALVCSICKYEAADEETITSHLESHPEAFDFPCRHCKKIFVTDSQRYRHEAVIHGGKFQCPYCCKVYLTRDNMKGHINGQHTGDRPFPCTLCNKAFFDRKGLKKHSTVHTGEKNNECYLCGKLYRLRGDLNKHYYTVHGDEIDKLYKCSECDFASNRIAEINIHKASEHAQICDDDSN